MKQLNFLALLLTLPVLSLAKVADPIWDYPTSPAELAWGRAMLSLDYPPRGMSTNPAYLPQIRWREFCGSGILWLRETSGGSLNGVLPLGKWGTSAMAISYWDYGQLERYNELGVPEGYLTPYSASAIMSYGTNIYDRLGMGINLKGSLQSLENEKDYQIGTDLAVSYRFKAISANLILQNWGPRYPLGDSLRFDLPLTISAGAGVSIFKERLKTAVQVNGPKDSDWYPSAAIVLSPWPVLALRAGYDGRPGLEAASKVGLGFSVNQTGQQDYSLEYGYRSYGDLGTVHAISLGMSF